MSVQHVTDHAARAQARLIQILKDKPNLAKLVAVFAGEIQALEDVLYDLLTKLLLDATGVQLDAVGQKRLGDSDGTYLKKIRARIAANRSRGTVEDIFRVFRIILDSDAGKITYGFEFKVTAVFKISGLAVDAAAAAALVQFLGIAKAAGVRALVQSSQYDDAHTFTFHFISFLSGAVGSGVSSLPVTDTSVFSRTGGTVYVDYGLSVQELVTYTGFSGSNLTLSAPTAHAHQSGAVVGPNAATEGFDDSSSPGGGGHLATIGEAS